jgi:16S rRNA (guanine527-N7)-methyltransferase
VAARRGFPLAHALPEREVTLLEATRRKCDFLERWARELPNVAGRLRPRGGAAGGLSGRRRRKGAGTAACGGRVVPAARRAGGAVVLYVGPTAQAGRVALVARAARRRARRVTAGLLVLRKLGPTPPGFPRRPGVARKRPLA